MQNGLGSGAQRPVYRPTSLDFINRPNPVEPQSVPPRHPLNGTPRLPNATHPALLRVLHEQNATASAERPAKRTKSGDGNLIDLPKLPVREGNKRPRLPPTLSGLYHPPPDAGLLPSISVEKPASTSEPPLLAEPVADERGLPPAPPSNPDAREDKPEEASTNSTSTKPRRHRWTDEETSCLLKGVARFGIGSWTKILKCEEYRFERRTALDLKDRFRVCCPEEYKGTKKQSPKTSRPDGVAQRDGKTSDELQSLGVKQPFTKIQRRKRHGYTADEDAALLKGFEKYGKVWTAIRDDSTLDLAHRTATDLRDRFRTRYPDKYKEAGLTPRPEVFPKPPQRGEQPATSKAETSNTTPSATTTAKPAELVSNDNKKSRPGKLSVPQPKLPNAKRPAQPSLLAVDDVFFGASFDDEAASEPIVLDRGILDLFPDSTRVTATDIPKAGIDPQMTWNVAKPAAGAPPQSINPPAGGNPSFLPSLATITDSQLDPGSQLELPSLIFGPFDNDGRTSGHVPSLDDLLI